MFRLIFVCACLAFYFLQACNPPVRMRPRNVKTGLDSTLYVGVVENPLSVDLRKERYLAKIKIGDLGVSLDCRYPDILGYATDRARKIGGNLLLITEHSRNEVKSNCHKIKAEIYRVQSLEGMEGRVFWHPARPLLRGDLRGKRDHQPDPAPLPRLQTDITCRLGGDFFKEAIARSETIFQCDSTFLPADGNHAAGALRRAQLHFDLAELHARQLKAALAALGPDLPALTGQVRDRTARQRDLLKSEQAALDAELASGYSESVLSRWETRVRADLIALEQYGAALVVDLRKKKQ